MRPRKLAMRLAYGVISIWTAFATTFMSLQAAKDVGYSRFRSCFACLGCFAPSSCEEEKDVILETHPASSQKKRVDIVFDIDGTLSFMHTAEAAACFEDDGKKLGKPLSPFFILQVLRDENRPHLTHNIFIPHVEHLFKYLLAQGFYISFFSANVEAGNQKLIAELLSRVFGRQEYERLKALGQFVIKSRQHLRDELGSDGRWHRYKDLRVMGKKVNLNDIILVEDMPAYIYPGQHPALIASVDMPQPFAALIGIEKYRRPQDVLALNHAYYFAGVISACLNLMEADQRLSLREALSQVLALPPGYSQIPSFPNEKTRDFLEKGLAVIQDFDATAYLFEY